MISKFSEDIHRFAISVDIVTESTYTDIKNMIGDYFCKQLNFNFVEILKADYDRSGKCEVLQTDWVKNSSEGILINKIFDADGRHTTQTASAYDRRKESWIIAKEDGLLSENEEYLDLWSSFDSFPRYESANEFNIKTSVILPILRKNRAWGVLNLESEEYLGTDVFDSISQEIKTIVKAFSIFTDLREATFTQSKNTEQMVRKLGDVLSTEKPRQFGKPKIFVASSSQSDKTVIASIRNILDRECIRRVITPIFWQDIHDTGDIRKQIVKEIEESNYGICYFSEPEQDSKNYRDNPNVLFEAGLLHAKRGFLTNTPDNWIPIREASSPNVPFDISGERILSINRLSNNKINNEEFEDQLFIKLTHMLNIDISI